jgi:predicted N-acyltransferase
VDDVGKESIDSIADDPFFTYGWFKTLETQRTYEVSPIYLAVYSESKVVGFVPLFIELIEPNSKDLFSVLLNLGHRIGFCQNRVLTCYSPLCFRSKILLSHGQEEKRILKLVSKKIDAICREQKILVSSFSFVSEFDRLLIENMQNYGYRKRLGVTEFYLDVQWSSFGEYLKSLKHKTREHVRREIRKCRESGVIIEESELVDLTAKLSELYTNLSLKYGKQAKKVYDSYFFSMLNMYAGEKTKLFIAKKNGEVIGFSLSLRHRDVLDVMMVGFDYAMRTNTDFSYFNLCYYAPINYAIESGVKKIYYRFLEDKIKLDRGCRLERTFGLVKYHNKLLRGLIGYAVK